LEPHQEEIVEEDGTLKTIKDIESLWESWFVPGISDFVRVPNLSELFDQEFKTNGLL
jgi:hypothetical protein